MAERAIVDTGFLVALLNRSDAHHAWAAELVPTLKGPWLTAEACVSEAVFLLQQAGRTSVEALLRWLEQGALLSRHCLPDQLEAIGTEMFAYRKRWVDFADACLVTLSDAQPKLPVVSVDVADFSVYFRRRSGRRLILPIKRR
ncbi:MAG TPA: PIN domain-containing protein [Polyangiaceae bacterium]|nr:PIN domain-containing protein [Polyangiaceae bacterium]